ncbi:putative azaleucine resistance protein AzlC [Selenomonas sp. oral taxon 137 str. F0430]|nr:MULTISPECIES: AzlC family ABC transporter permease [Selenomonas]EFR40572.1 putative azaleucine resistance protein AzlC [Selenomonas sp. oral taxon 137 str. F0430]EJP31758.1 putative azaleucine resistance protein AzlC [Selenomonas sp. FOBRC9]
MNTKSTRLAALRAAFPYTVPIFAGFWFVGVAYGVYMNASGFSFWYPLFMSALIFGGSLEFIAVALLLSPFAPMQTFLLALMVQARHIFYGLSMFEKYGGTGWKKPYLIFGMCDESFAVNYTAKIPHDVDAGWFMFFVTLLNHVYWVAGAVFGGLIGGSLPFDTTGINFVMTAMFVVIFIEQWMNDTQHYTGVLGLAAAGICLTVFGRDAFMIPTMTVILTVCLIARPYLERRAAK